MNRPTVSISQRGWRQAAVVALVVLAALLLVGYAMYDIGLRRAGFKTVEAAADIKALKRQNAELVRQNKRLSGRIAVLRTATKIDQEGYRRVEEELSDLQGKIVEQQEDIEFYEGIVNDDGGPPLRIQEFRVRPGLNEFEFNLQLVLAQAFRSDREIQGKVELALIGLQRSEPTRLELGEVQRGKSGSGVMSYSFRYFQNLRAEVVLPAEFQPERVQVIVRPQGGSAQTVEESFVWKVEQG